MLLRVSIWRRSTIALMRLILSREPVLTLAVIQAVLAALVWFGILPLTNDQVTVLMGVLAAMWGWLIRQRVSPV